MKGPEFLLVEATQLTIRNIKTSPKKCGAPFSPKKISGLILGVLDAPAAGVGCEPSSSTFSPGNSEIPSFPGRGVELLWLGESAVGSTRHVLLGCVVSEVDGSMVNGSMGYFTDPYK